MIEYKKQEKKPGKQILIALMLIVLVISSVLAGCGAKKTADNENVAPENTVQEETVATEPAVTEVILLMPWEEVGAKQPAEYTWEEYEALTGLQQKAFRDYLDKEYSKWLDGIRAHANVKPWGEPGAKQPDEYTWDEFTALTPAQQMAFQQYLGLDAFSAWMNSVQTQVGEMPWDVTGAKQPADYTWEEFDSLTGSQQMIFQYHLGPEGFKNWLEAAERQDEVFPWETDGAKQPAEYSWEEFTALTPAQQMAFQSILGIEAFDNWLNKAQIQDVTYPWEKAGVKQPENYTWEEFEALDPAQQMAFQEHMGAESFENWMNRAQSQLEKTPWEKTGAKQPENYTWEEFEALDPAQQMAFQEHMGAESFDDWMNRAQAQLETNPWEEAGAKPPEDYAWAEFESLTPAQQMAFQEYMGLEGFDAWLNKNVTP